jgi:hypothetical protein
MLDLYLITDAAQLHKSKPVASLPTGADSPLHAAIRRYQDETGREIDLYATTRVSTQDLVGLRRFLTTDQPAELNDEWRNLFAALDTAINLNQSFIAVGD